MALPFTFINPGSHSGETCHRQRPNCHKARESTFTGDISGCTLLDCGARFARLRNLERRVGREDDNDAVRAKVSNARPGLAVSLCAEDSPAVFNAELVKEPVCDPVLASLPDILRDADTLPLARDPVCSISWAVVSTPFDIGAMVSAIREAQLGEPAKAIRLLYGCCVDDTEAEMLPHIPNVDSVLIGYASLEHHYNRAIIGAAHR